LILEDEPDIREILEYALKRDGFDVISATDGQAGLAAARRSCPT
jgi:two-component system alkaline phosphatase synthesis response regulator PhoP